MMKITKINIYKLNVRLKFPVRVPIGTIESAQNVIVKIHTDQGLYGMGEASPFSPITGDTQASNFEVAKDLAALIKGKNPLAIEQRMAEINRHVVREPAIRSAFDMALYDILGKAAGLPLYALLGGEKRRFRTGLTVGMQDTVEQTVERAKRVFDLGFEAIKLKVGRSGLQDVPHVEAVRDLAGPNRDVKIDSNQGWDFPTAVANLQALEHCNLQYSEQPLAAWDYDNIRRLRDKVSVPICVDESVFDEKDALKLVTMGAADYLNIKLGKSGGLHVALKINAIAESAGCKCMIGCFAESRLGLSAAAHLVLARPNIFFVDLDSAYEFRQDPVIGGMTYDDEVGGLIHIPDEPGHGADIDSDYLQTLESFAV